MTSWRCGRCADASEAEACIKWARALPLSDKGHLLPDFYSGATGLPGRFSEGVLLRRFQGSSEPLDVHTGKVTEIFGAIKYAAKGPFWWNIRDDLAYVKELALAMNGLRLGAPGGVLRGRTH